MHPCNLPSRHRPSILRLAICAVLAALLHPAHATLADSVSSQSLVSNALSVANSVDDQRQKAQMLDLIANAQAQNGDIAGAKRTAAQIVIDQSGNQTDAESETGWKYDAYAAIAGAQAARGDVAAANDTLNRISDPGAQSQAYQYMAQAYARTGDLADANACAAHATGQAQAKAYTAIAQATAAAGDIDGAKDIALNLQDKSEQAKAYLAISETQAKNGDLAAARATIDLAEWAARDVPDYLSRKIWGAIAKADVEAGDLDGAIALRKVDDSYIAREIAIGRAESGDFAGAVHTIAQISDPLDQACADAAIAIAAANAGKHRGAAQALDCARIAASTATDTNDHPDDCARIIEAWAKAGDPSAAADWARSQQDPVVEVTSLLTVANALGNPQFSSAD